MIWNDIWYEKIYDMIWYELNWTELNWIELIWYYESWTFKRLPLYCKRRGPARVAETQCPHRTLDVCPFSNPFNDVACTLNDALDDLQQDGQDTVPVLLSLFPQVGDKLFNCSHNSHNETAVANRPERCGPSHAQTLGNGWTSILPEVPAAIDSSACCVRCVCGNQGSPNVYEGKKEDQGCLARQASLTVFLQQCHGF